jgi:hypothetical protein
MTNTPHESIEHQQKGKGQYSKWGGGERAEGKVRQGGNAEAGNYIYVITEIRLKNKIMLNASSTMTRETCVSRYIIHHRVQSHSIIFL